MRITFDNNTHPNTDRVTTTYSNTRAQESAKAGAFAADISGTVMDNNAYGVQGRTAEEVMQEAQVTDVTTQRNYMAVMSNSMSTEDFAEMLEEGVDPNDMDIETVVTIVDRIKAELVKSGVSVAGYTDDLDSETLTQIVGSESFANQLQNAFMQNDIPVIEENVEAVIGALNEASQLTQPSDGELKYLVNNGMEPTIENLYMAEHSGAIDANRQGKGYYQENFGYYAKKAETVDFEKLLPQVEKIVEEAGLVVDEETIKQAEWMVEKGIPLTIENISCLYENSRIEFPLKKEDVLQAIVGTLAEGKRPMQANLAQPQNKYQKAAEISKVVEEWLQDSSLSITARRQLEEARLRMTAEVNVRLVESGFSIDTSDMEAFVEALKKAEEQQAKKMFPEQSAEEANSRYDLYRETLAQTSLLPGLPVATLGRVIFEEKLTVTVENLVHEGTKLQADYQKAGEAYETLMTAPRRDMGDSIRKAFANVDDILQDIGMELTAENQRAVRILSYNQLAITPENLEQVRAADRKVQRVIDKMTPASTLKMIREGMNPLTMDMADMEEYFKDQSNQPEQEMENYSRYLHRLEKNQDITPEERDAYIGVYRMLRQIEKSDGAVIGSVLKAQSDLSFKQLLTAARTAKKAGMNILVDESFGGLEELKTEGIAIDEQINNIDTIRSLKNVESDVIKTLNQLDLPITANYVMAAATLTESANPLFGYIRNQLSNKSSNGASGTGSRKDSGKETSVDLADREIAKQEEETLFDSLAETLTESLTGREEMQQAYRSFGEQITEFLKDDLYTPGQTSLDVRAMKSASLQLSVAMRMSGEETYEIPAMLHDGVTAIRLTIRHQSEENGQASISLETENYGRVQAFIQVKRNEVTGYITGKEDMMNRLESLKDNLGSAFVQKNLTLSDFKVMATENKASFPNAGENEEKTSARIVYEAAKIVIKSIRDIL